MSFFGVSWWWCWCWCCGCWGWIEGVGSKLVIIRLCLVRGVLLDVVMVVVGGEMLILFFRLFGSFFNFWVFVFCFWCVCLIILYVGRGVEDLFGKLRLKIGGFFCFGGWEFVVRGLVLFVGRVVKVIVLCLCLGLSVVGFVSCCCFWCCDVFFWSCFSCCFICCVGSFWLVLLGMLRSCFWIVL